MNCRASCMDFSIRHQIRYMECDIKDFTKMVDAFRTKNTLTIPTIRGRLYPYYIHICLKQNELSNEEMLL